MNSVFGIFVLELKNFHLLERFSRARSIGMLVNKDITSNEKTVSELANFVPESLLYRLKL